MLDAILLLQLLREKLDEGEITALQLTKALKWLKEADDEVIARLFLELL